MKKTLLLMFALLILGGVTSVKAGKVPSTEYTSVLQLSGKSFAIVNKAAGKAVYHKASPSPFTLGYDSYGTAFASDHYLFKIEEIDDDGDPADGKYLIRCVNEDGSLYTESNGKPYFQSNITGSGVCFFWELNGQRGMDEHNTAAWDLYYDSTNEGWTIKNVYTGKYYNDPTQDAMSENPAYFTFCELGESVDENVEITVGGDTRNYQLYVPGNVADDCPLVISLHGAGGHSTDYSPFRTAVADMEGCIVAYPQGKTQDFYILGATNTGWNATGEENEDVAFLKAVIEDVASKYQIDRKRIYCCGFSNGGMMTYALSNACSDEIAAFASISGYPLNEFHLRHTGERPVPFLHIHGKADDFVLYAKMPTIVDEMVARLGANPVPATTSGSGYTKNVYAAADGSFPYIYYEIDGMGHVDFTDKTEDGSSALTMWNFFEQYTLDMPCKKTQKWAPRIEEDGYTPAEHGWTVNSGTTLLQFGSDYQYTAENKNVYHSLQLNSGTYNLSFTSTGAAGKKIGVKIEKLTSPNTVVLNTSVNAGEAAELHFNVADGWGEYKLTMTRPDAGDAITISDINIKADAEYEAAMEAITDGKVYRISTMVNRTTYYLTTTGTLTDTRDEAGLFTFTKSSPASDYLYANGWDLGYKFTNPDWNWGTSAPNNNGSIHCSASDNRDTWERQVFFKNAAGKYAVRATNASGAAWGANTYWCVDDASEPTAGYSNDPAYIWELKQVETIEKTTPLLLLKNGSINTTDFDITPTGTSSLTTDNLYSATFTSKGTIKNVFQYQNLDVSAYDKAVIKYSITDENEWRIVKPDNHYALPTGSNQTYEIDLSSTNTYTDFSIFSSYQNHTAGSSITISEVYLYAANYINDTKPVLEFNEYGSATIAKNYLTATGGLTYNASTGALSSDGTEGSLVLEFDYPVDLKYLKHFNVTNSGSTADILDNLQFYDEDGTLINTWNSIKLSNTWNPAGIDNAATNAFLDHKPVKRMVWPSAAAESKNGKTATITSVEFMLKTISCAKAGETQLNTLDWNKKDGSGTATPDWNMNGSSDTYYGNYSGDATHYADLTAFSELRVYCKDNNTGFRCFFINAAGTATNQIHTAAATWNAEKKYYSLNLSTIEKWNDKVALKSIKSDNVYGVTEQNVTNIVVYNTPAEGAPQYTLTGSGLQLAETVAALADATATCIDATGVTGITTNSEKGQTLLTSANPNCIFLGTTGNGGLANTNNVKDGTTIANLVITDGYPFAVPAGATATAATYTRAMANQFGTICLPYPVSSTATVKYYTIASLSGDELTLHAEENLAAGTPAIVEKVSGDAITVTGSGALAVAGEPTEDLALIGTYTAKTILASTYTPRNIYAISNNQFVQATTDITLPAFRAYFVNDNTAAASLRLGFEEEGATAIEALSGEGDVVVEGIYSLDGTQIPSLQQGVNVVKFTNGEVKKVIVK